MPSIALPESLTAKHTAFVVCLVANADRIAEVRRNRAMILSDRDLNDYVDRDTILAELQYSRRICAKNNWPVIDVTRRSVEETAATIIKLLNERRAEQRLALQEAVVGPAGTRPVARDPQQNSSGPVSDNRGDEE